MNRILIAEDELRLAAFVKKGLGQNGFDVTIAEDGEMAIHLLMTQEFDVLLLDVGLPIKDGWTVLQEARSQNYKLPIIIIMTAMSDNGNRERAITLGANEFVAKPFKFSELLAKIQVLLSQ